MEPSKRCEAVTVAPPGQSTIARYALRASTLGYDGIVVRNHDERYPRSDLSDLTDESGIAIHRGIELSPSEPDDISGRLPDLGATSQVVIVKGGRSELNAFIAGQRHVDVLATPLAHDRSVLSMEVIRNAMDADVAIELNFRPLLSPGGSRVRHIRLLERLWALIEKYEVPYVASVRPERHLELRTVRDLAALSAVIGLSDECIQEGLTEWTKRATTAKHDRGE